MPSHPSVCAKQKLSPPRANTLGLPLPPPPRLLPLLPFLLCLVALLPGAAAQDIPVTTINEECMSLAYAPDGRLAYAVRHLMTTRRLEIQRDDIWVLFPDGKRKKIVNGEKLIQGPAALSYTVQSLRWSPDGSRLTAELLTSQMINDRGDTQEATLTLLLDENGKEIKIAGGDSVIPEGTNASWLGDGVTVVYLQEAVKPKLLFAIGSVRPIAGRGGVIFAGHTYVAVAWDARHGRAVAIERDRSLSGPPRLVELDLIKEATRDLATLEGFTGGLTLSPSGRRAAYFRDPETLEVREVAAPERAVRLRIGYGAYDWAPDERRILLKHTRERRTGDLIWISVPEGRPPDVKSGSPVVVDVQPQAALHGLTFRDFDISPDGRFLAVIQPGKRNLLIYPAP